MNANENVRFGGLIRVKQVFLGLTWQSHLYLAHSVLWPQCQQILHYWRHLVTEFWIRIFNCDIPWAAIQEQVNATKMESTFLTHRRRWQHGDMLFAPISEARTSFVGSFCEVKGYAEDRSLRTYRSIYTYRRTHAHTQTRPTHAPTTRTHTHTHEHTRAEKSHMPIFFG